MKIGDACVASGVRRILVMNGKGGCGKTTIATNLAVAYAAAGRRVVLIDNDRQGAGAYWAAQRPPTLPAVPVVRAWERDSEDCRLEELVPPAVDRLIVDGGTGERDLQWLLQQADAVLVPILPSSIDIRIGSRCIADVLTHRCFRAKPIPLGVLANRVEPNADSHARLKHFLGCLGQPIVTTFRCSPVYSEAIGTGRGVVDMLESRAARKETPAWRELIAWIDAQTPRARPAASQIRRMPAAAGHRHRSAKRRAMSA